VREFLYSIIEDNTTQSGKKFDYFIQVLIILSSISFSIDTLPNLSESFRSGLDVFETVTVIIFSLEYILRLYVSKKPLSYMFSFYGIVDILAILPFYINIFVDLRFLRVFRIFRVFRALKLLRYSKAIKRFNLAFKIVKEEVVLFIIVSIVLIFISSAIIYYFENESQPDVFSSIFHSAWWSIVTLTTVGYGDVYPITLGGKIFTFFVLMIGVGFVTVPAGLVATALSKARELEED